ncbi:hypothetical protein ACRAWD_28980 [Caulobacter segnis]
MSRDRLRLRPSLRPRCSSAGSPTPSPEGDRRRPHPAPDAGRRATASPRRRRPPEAISHLGGEMHFLGVKVVEGGVETSLLERPAQA